MKYLIVNTGSTSKKYAFFNGKDEVLNVALERQGDAYSATLKINNNSGKITICAEEYYDPHKHIRDLLIANKVIEKRDDIDAIGIRIVAPGNYFLNHNNINEMYLQMLISAKEVAPLHIEGVMEEIRQLKLFFPNIKLIGISDTEFHKGRPDISRFYAIPKSVTEKYELYKFGYHGISISSVLQKLKKIDSLHSKIIICHLGGGSSITALKDGKSFDTSMGFSPIEGVPMASRSGDFDPGALLYLARKMNFTEEQMENYLNNECGLLGLSEKSSDPRILIQAENEGDEKSKLALDIFTYRVKKYIGSYVAALNGVDILVFTGAIGERSFILRERICKDLGYLGIVLDEEKNNAHEDKEGLIESEDSDVKIAIVKTDEMGEMARQVRKIIKAK